MTRKKMDSKKVKHIQTILRTVRGLSLREVREITGHSITGMSLHENKIMVPDKKIILSIANVLDVNPDILFYSYGILPEYEEGIIKEDPFYYMDKIRKICHNHEKRYGDKDVDLNKLNAARAFEYIVKESKDGKDEKE
jgi:transcriptional regulator with XRE-family HTH domain